MKVNFRILPTVRNKEEKKKDEGNKKYETICGSRKG